MEEIVIVRTETGDDGTFGSLSAKGFRGVVGELPWKNNEQDKSCVPPGSYPAFQRWSPSRSGWVIELRDVPGREYIQLHVGNYSGGVDEGKKTDSLGCLLPGSAVGRLKPKGFQRRQKAVTNSRDAMQRLLQITAHSEDILVTIIDATGEAGRDFNPNPEGGTRE